MRCPCCGEKVNEETISESTFLKCKKCGAQLHIKCRKWFKKTRKKTIRVVNSKKPI